MCGFAGVWLADPRAQPEQALLADMAGALVLRGPDDGSFHVGPGAGLAFRRLSIIDLAGGRQPFTVGGGAIAAVVNGEIYNWRELRAELEAAGTVFASDSDCEVIPHLYARHGPGFVERVAGMFAFAIVDRRGPVPKLLLGRDRLGIKPLFWAETPRGLVFASEPKALLASGFVPRTLRRTALLDYLVQGYVGGDEAAFPTMRRLPPAHTLLLTHDAPPRLARYWDLPLDVLRDEAAPEEILAELDRRVADHMVADVPLGAFLSGGVDSNAVVDSMARQSSAPVVACSVGFAEKSHDELDIARRSAARLGARHFTERLDPDPVQALEHLPWIFCEPHGDPSCLPTWLVSRMAREHVTVALSGDGGDETFAGYRRYVHDVAEHRMRRLATPPGAALLGALGSVWPRSPRLPRYLRAGTFLRNVGGDPARAYWRSVTAMERSEALDLLPAELAASLDGHDPFERFAAFYRRPNGGDGLYRAQYADFHTYLPDQILAKVDRASMGVSLEVRVPLLDHRFVERFAPLPARAKVQAGRGKVAFREALRSRLPSEVLDGAKRGFDTPLARWFAGPLSAALDDALATLPRSWFRPDALARVAGEHKARRRDHGRLLWSLLMLEHWRRRHGVGEELGD